MVLIVAQVVCFFEGSNQIDIPHVTRVQLQHERITVLSDLVKFMEEAINIVSHNLRNLGGSFRKDTPYNIAVA